MSLARAPLPGLAADMAAVGEAVLRPEAPMRRLGEHLEDLFTDLDFGPLYEPGGRHAISPARLALITLFQFLEHLPDRQAAQQVAVRLDWKYALHLPLAEPGFDHSVLCRFRQRLLDHQAERVVFDTLLTRIRALGFLIKPQQQRTDAWAVLGAVKQLSHLETVTETLRLALRTLQQQAPGWTERVVPASYRETYLARLSEYRLTPAEREARLLAVGEDGAWLLARLAVDPPPGGVVAREELATLRTVWTQRYQRTETGGLVATPTAVPAPERVVTPHDPGLRVGEKRGKTWVGEKVHLTETAGADEPRFLTDVTTLPASSGDTAALPVIRQHLAERDLRPDEQVVDAGYVSGQSLAQSAAAGIDLLGPPLDDTSRAEFKLSAFTLDRVAQQAWCPAGHGSCKWSPRRDRDGSQAVNIQFPAAVCAACPLRARCTSATTAGRSLHLSEHYERLVAQRARAQTEAFQTTYRRRAGIEATGSELIRAHDFRRHRYRGEAKRHLENLLKGAACNLKRLLHALTARWLATLVAPAARPAAQRLALAAS